MNFGATSFLGFILLSRAAPVSRARKTKAIAVADPGAGSRGPAPLLFLDETEVRRAEKIFLGGHSSHLPPPPCRPLIWRSGYANPVFKYDYKINDVKTRQESYSQNSVFETSVFSFSGHELVQYGLQGSGTSTSPSRAQQRRRDWAQGQEQQQRQPSDYDVSHFFNG